MVFLKSILAGLGALVLGAIFAIAVLFGLPIVKSFMAQDGGDVHMVSFYLWPTLAVSLLIFAAGFYRQWRRR